MDFARLQARLPLIVWAVLIATVILIPLTVLGLGYLPGDDALRHAAKAISGKAWPEILIVREGASMDHHPGWHWFLGLIANIGNLGAESLVMVSVLGLFCIFVISGLVWLRYAEAWILALTICILSVPSEASRLLCGRPLLVTMTSLLLLLWLWRDPVVSVRKWVISLCLFAISTWMHGVWYLFGMMLFCLVLTARWRSAWNFALCWVAGTFLGACLTGHPIAFGKMLVEWAYHVFDAHNFDSNLVSELQAYDPGVHPVVVTILFLVIRKMTGRWDKRPIWDPMLALATVGFVLGLKAGRFWFDWGVPAWMAWMALELNDLIGGVVESHPVRRLLIVMGSCGALFLLTTADFQSRWTVSLRRQYISSQDPQTAGWLPDKGGIIYDGDMSIFFETFFKNPHGDWKYMLGFEPGMMPLEDQKIFRMIQSSGSVDAWELWVKKMKPEDRIFIRQQSQPPIKELEWNRIAGIWIGRFPVKKLEAPGAQ